MLGSTDSNRLSWPFQQPHYFHSYGWLPRRPVNLEEPCAYQRLAVRKRAAGPGPEAVRREQKRAALLKSAKHVGWGQARTF